MENSRVPSPSRRRWANARSIAKRLALRAREPCERSGNCFASFPHNGKNVSTVWKNQCAAARSSSARPTGPSRKISNAPPPTRTTVLARPPVQRDRDPRPQRRPRLLRGERRRFAAAVRARHRRQQTEFAHPRQRHGVVRHAESVPVPRRGLQHQRQRPRPKRRRQPLGERLHANPRRADRFDPGGEIRDALGFVPPLGLIEPRHGFRRIRARGHAVHRLRRHDRQLPRPHDLRRAADVLRRRRHRSRPLRARGHSRAPSGPATRPPPAADRCRCACGRARPCLPSPRRTSSCPCAAPARPARTPSRPAPRR